MDAPAHAPHHARVRVLPHVTKLDDCFRAFLVRVTCLVPGVPAHRAGSAGTDRRKSATLAALARRMRKAALLALAVKFEAARKRR